MIANKTFLILHKFIVPILQSMPPPPMEADVTTDTSTFIASTTIDAQPSNQQMTRRVGKVGGDEIADKEIRRDSKGFENFDDYFESDGNDSTITSGDKTNEITNESVEEETTEIAKETQSSEKGMNLLYTIILNLLLPFNHSTVIKIA